MIKRHYDKKKLRNLMFPLEPYCERHFCFKFLVFLLSMKKKQCSFLAVPFTFLDNLGIPCRFSWNLRWRIQDSGCSEITTSFLQHMTTFHVKDLKGNIFGRALNPLSSFVTALTIIYQDFFLGGFVSLSWGGWTLCPPSHIYFKYLPNSGCCPIVIKLIWCAKHRDV